MGRPVVTQLAGPPALQSARPHHPLRGKDEMASDEYPPGHPLLYTTYTRRGCPGGYQALAELGSSGLVQGTADKRPTLRPRRLPSTLPSGVQQRRSAASSGPYGPLRPNVFGSALPATLRTARFRCCQFARRHKIIECALEECGYPSRRMKKAILFYFKK